MENNQHRLQDALIAIARRLPEGLEVGLLDKSGSIAGTRTGNKAMLTLGWNAVSDDEANSVFTAACDEDATGLLHLGGQHLWYYPVKKGNEVVLVLGVLGYGVLYGDQLIVQTAADVMSALLS